MAKSPPDIYEEIISRTKYVDHVKRRLVTQSDRKEFTRRVIIEREVIKLPRAGQVLPYFKDSRGKWKVVLVSQYRITAESKTIEASGGIIDEKETPKEALARELKEETKIKVRPRDIQIVLYENPLISLLDGALFGGIVRISAKDVKNKNKAGLDSESEWTQVEVFDLAKLLKKRSKMDMMTSRLLDEVAKKTGLLAENY